MEFKTRREESEFRLMVNDCDNKREILNDALNRMHLAETYEELREWHEWSIIHLGLLNKVLQRKIQYKIEHNTKKEI